MKSQLGHKDLGLGSWVERPGLATRCVPKERAILICIDLCTLNSYASNK